MTVFEVVSPTDDFETIKNGITLVARLLQYFPFFKSYFKKLALAIGRFLKTYLHIFKNVSHNFTMLLHFQQYVTSACLSRAYNI